MSDRFVSAGTIGASGEVSKDAPAAGNQGSGSNGNGNGNGNGNAAPAKPLNNGARSLEWEAVQQQLDAERRRREEARVKAATGGEEERSLYDILQANKAAKQAAFEEASKVRNQFRALDDDEIEFLDEVRAKQRAEEDAARKEVEKGLKAFREQQKKDLGEASAAAAAAEEGGDGDDDGTGEQWGVVGRKRKRVKEREGKGKGVVRRRTSGAGEGDVGAKKGEEKEVKKGEEARKKKAEETAGKKPPEKKALALVGYGSDSASD